MIVVDTNILVYLLIPDSGFDEAEKLLDKDSEWAAPLLWRSEFRNVLSVYFQKKLLTFDQLLQIQNTAEDLLIGHEYELSSPHILELVRQSTCSAYDCEFIALAKHLDVPLVTQDKKVLREFPNTAMNISQYLEKH